MFYLIYSRVETARRGTNVLTAQTAKLKKTNLLKKCGLKNMS